MIRAEFGIRLNAVDWTAIVGFFGEAGDMAAIELTIESFLEQARDIQWTIEKGIDLANTLMQMRDEGKTVHEMDAMFKAISADGGL